MPSWTKTKPPLWRVILLISVGVISAVLLFASSQRESRWRVSFDLSNWRVYGSDSVEFDSDGTRVRSRKAYHLWTCDCVQRGHAHECTPNRASHVLSLNVHS